MLQTLQQPFLTLAVVLSICCQPSGLVHAKKGGGGGNGGGGGGGAPTVSYSLTLLGTLGGNYSIAEGLNEQGDVVGWSLPAVGGASHAFLNTTDGNGGRVMLDLNDLLTPADQALWLLKEALDINDNGQIVGWGDLFDAGGQRIGSRAFRLTPGSPPTIENLDTLGGDSSQAAGVNNHGDVVGTSLDANGQDHAFMYTDANGDGAEEMIDLGVFGGATRTNGDSINNMAQACRRLGRQQWICLSRLAALTPGGHGKPRRDRQEPRKHFGKYLNRNKRRRRRRRLVDGRASKIPCVPLQRQHRHAGFRYAGWRKQQRHGDQQSVR